MKTILASAILTTALCIGTASAQHVSVKFGSSPRATAPSCYVPPPCAARPVYYRYAPTRQAQHGYWKLQHKRVQVPGQWVQWITPCGKVQSKWAPGGYRTISQYVWVPYTPPPSHGSTITIVRR
ncbi:MAG TPA: hypothetical protein PKE12_09200 [Kiritimatiellia bacterium]|nr:hypothetical protein [Kiritimatiellia bacterium]